MTGIIVLVMSLFLILLLALFVVIAVVVPRRGRDLPGGAVLTRRVRQVAERAAPAQTPAAYGVLSSPERARRAQRWFERVERRIVAIITRRAPAPARHASDAVREPASK